MTSNAESRARRPSEPGVPAASDAASVEDVPEELREFGKYQVERRVGAGGMGTVYRALDTQLRRTVALKILPSDRAENPILVRRFESEAQSAAALHHENIVNVFETGQEKGHLFIALEFVEGPDVLEILAERPGGLDVAQTIDIVRQTTAALQHAYERGIVHRDIKPSNLMLDERGTVKLTDMGLARSVDEAIDTGITRDGTTVGTVDYMAPEQARNSKAADVRSDVYSLGCTWYHMLTGRVPFPKGSPANKLLAHATRERPDPRRLRPAIPAEVVEVVRRMMERSPSKRYQTPRELLEALDSLATVRIDPDEEAFVERLEEATAASEATRDTSSEVLRTRSEPRPRRARRSEGRKTPKRSDAERPSRRSGGRTVGILGAVVGVGLLVGLGVWMSQPGDGGSESPERDVARLPHDPTPPDGGRVTPPDVRPGDPKDPVEPIPPDPVEPAVGIGRDTEKTRFPEWLREIPDVEDGADPAAVWKMAAVTVGGGDGVRYRELSDALETAGGEARLIRLSGPGPFVLPPLSVSQPGSIVIVGDPDARSLIRIAGETDSTTALSFNGLSLTMVDVDLEADLPQTSADAVLSVRDGDLVMRRCSVTVLRGSPASVLSVSEPDPGTTPVLQRPPRVLLDRILVRADDSDVITCRAEGIDFLLWNGLLATNDGAALRVAPGSPGPEGVGERVRRFDLTSCTLFSNREAVRIEAAAAKPPATRIDCHNSLVATRAPEGTLLHAVGWPVVGTSDGSRFQLSGFEWSTISSTYAGWDEVVRAEFGGETYSAEGFTGWRRTLEPSAFASQFPASRWPRTAFEVVFKQPVATFERSTAGARADDGQPAGAAVDLLGEPADAVRALADELALRPEVPAPFVASLDEPALTIDAADDVGRVLAEAKLPNEARVVVTGSGTHSCRPIFVKDKSLRIEFHPNGDEELVLRVRGDRLTAEDSKQGRKNAFVTVVNGSIEIDNGLFEFPNLTVGTPLEWFLHATDSNFALRRTEVRGPTVEVEGLRELIRWESTSDEGPRHLAAFDESYVLTHVPLLRGDGRHRSLVVSDSILVSRGTLFDLDVGGIERDLGTRVGIRQSTLATDDTVFVIRGGEIPGGVAQPMRFFVDASVFGPAADFVEPAPRGPVLLAAPEAVGRQGQLVWRGRDNAYWDGFHAFVVDRAAGEPPKQDFRTAWAEPWGDRVVRPLHESEAVRYLGGRPRHDVATRAAFELSPRSKAATWRLDGAAIGGDPAIGQERRP